MSPVTDVAVNVLTRGSLRCNIQYGEPVSIKSDDACVYTSISYLKEEKEELEIDE